MSLAAVHVNGRRLPTLQICARKSTTPQLVHQHHIEALWPACCAACRRPACCLAARGVSGPSALPQPKYRRLSRTPPPGSPGSTPPAAPADVAGPVRRDFVRRLGGASGMLRCCQCIWGGPRSRVGLLRSFTRANIVLMTFLAVSYSKSLLPQGCWQ